MRKLGSVLVTGGAGFVGSALVKRLLREEDVSRVIVLERKAERECAAVFGEVCRDPRINFVQGEVSDLELLNRIVEEGEVEGVFHLVGNQNSESGGDDLVTTYVQGAFAILEVTREIEIPLLLSSSDSVYGSVASPDKASEASGLNPQNFAAASEAARDLLALAAFRSEKQDVVLARSSCNYGANLSAKSWLGGVIGQAAAGGRVVLQGDGMQIRDWIHVDDHARGLIAAWRRGKAGEIYHFGGACERTNLGMVRQVLEILGIERDRIQFEEARSGEGARLALNCEKSRMWFGWEPEIDFQEAFPEVVKALAARFRG